MRADSERTVLTILSAAERMLRKDPSASIQQIADSAGVARTTVHRRFATREVLIAAMSAHATQEFSAAVDSCRPEALPPGVALHRVTAKVLAVKMRWGFALANVSPADVQSTRVHVEVLERCDRLFRRAQEAGLLCTDVDLTWIRRVYYALVGAAAEGEVASGRAEELATLVVDTLMRGVGAKHAL
ncbi:TetR/AcrR family transcriptional regulator [Kitasatospora sp. SUK 42]|uniref:TetR/AcrR family transcriptional regulator n=1 Tax=Kitasatospora sp. SUK 42 TaxID=1588882 RepID=UPI0020C8E35C|nr:TetR/AcrR family transcriptional regulator [Kitasatospora sp. SUK 42]